MVAEEGVGRGGVDPALGEQRLKRRGGLWPKGTHALLPSLAEESDLEGPHKLEITRSHVEDLLDPRACIE